MFRLLICVLWTVLAIWVGVNVIVLPSGAIWIILAILAWLARVLAG